MDRWSYQDERPMTQVTGGTLQPVPTHVDLSWYDHAQCVAEHAPTEWFFPGQGERPDRGLEVCARCPVRAECGDLAEQTNVLGVWGGKFRIERRRRGRAYDGDDAA